MDLTAILIIIGGIVIGLLLVWLVIALVSAALARKAFKAFGEETKKVHSNFFNDRRFP